MEKIKKIFNKENIKYAFNTINIPKVICKHLIGQDHTL